MTAVAAPVGEARLAESLVARPGGHGHPGALLVLEGIDGSGRSTHARLLEDFLRYRGRAVTRTSLATSELAGEPIRRAKRDRRAGPGGDHAPLRRGHRRAQRATDRPGAAGRAGRPGRSVRLHADGEGRGSWPRRRLAARPCSGSPSRPTASCSSTPTPRRRSPVGKRARSIRTRAASICISRPTPGKAIGCSRIASTNASSGMPGPSGLRASRPRGRSPRSSAAWSGPRWRSSTRRPAR